MSTKTATHILPARTLDPACARVRFRPAGPVFEEGRLIIELPFPSLSVAILKQFNPGFLADVLLVWEGNDGQWLHKGPLLLRFERYDLLIATHHPEGPLSVWAGQIDTSVRPLPHLNDTPVHRAENQTSCLQWLRYQPLHTAIGHTTTAVCPYNQGHRLMLSFDYGWALDIASSPEGLSLFLARKAA